MMIIKWFLEIYLDQAWLMPCVCFSCLDLVLVVQPAWKEGKLLIFYWSAPMIFSDFDLRWIYQFQHQILLIHRVFQSWKQSNLYYLTQKEAQSRRCQVSFIYRILSCWWKCCFLLKQQACRFLMAMVQIQQKTMITRTLMEMARTVTMETGSLTESLMADRRMPLPLSIRRR